MLLIYKKIGGRDDFTQFGTTDNKIDIKQILGDCLDLLFFKICLRECTVAF